MNKIIANKWVKALQSGRFKQGHMCLDSGRGDYCVLGVLCKVASEEGIEVALTTEDDMSYRIIGEGLNHQPEVKKWAGIKSHYGLFIEKDLEVTLANLNDNEEKDFKELAKIISKVYREL